MKVRNTWFLSAMARILASASTSVSELGSASAAGDLMPDGTMASVSASSEAWPTTSSICAISASLGPMWRSTNAWWCSSSRRVGVFWDMAGIQKSGHARSEARTGRVMGDNDPPDPAVFLGAPLSFCLRV